MSGKVKIEFKPHTEVFRRIFDDDVGTFAAETTARYMEQYVPMDTGTLAQGYETKPWKITYTQPYAHYLYEGKLYVDPVYKKGAFYDKEYGFWSRPGVEKEPTDIDLNISKEKHPNAQPKWDVPTQKNNVNDIAAEITDYLRKR